jgi:hypothetical protein
MSDAAESKTAAAGRANTNKPEAAAKPEPAAAAVTAEPCGCGERLNALEGRMSAYEGVNRALSYLMLAAAAAVIYILWTGGPGSGSGDDKK